MKVAVIDDSPDIKEVVSICFQLRWSSCNIVSAENGNQGLKLVEEEEPDVVVLDLGLPDIDGLQVLREIRRFSQVPIIVLTVRNQDVDVARALELGADDYITKPFSHIELVARVQAVMRRTTGTAVSDERPYSTEGLFLDFSNNIFKLNDEDIKLTSIEIKLLHYLVRNEGRLLTHENLLSRVWGDSYQDGRDMLRVHIQHLRQKLGDNSQVPRMIVTEHGLGYKFQGKY